MSTSRIRARGAPHRPLALAFGLALIALAVGAPAAAAAQAAPSSGGSLTTTASVSPEVYYLRLLNCSRTGGYVNADGSCAGYGSGRFSKYVSPIKLNYGITQSVSWPYAKLLAVKNRCEHNLDGDPGYRFRRAGYHPSWWGENIGCRNGSTNVYSSILASHRAFQAEKPSNGGHWRNIKNSAYLYVGIGIYRYGDRIRLVTDFYRPG